MGNILFAHQLAHHLAQLARLLEVAVRQQHGEFLAAVTGRHFAGPARPAGQGLRHGPKALVAGDMTVGVVEALEIVDVDHEQRQRHPCRIMRRHSWPSASSKARRLAMPVKASIVLSRCSSAAFSRRSHAI